MEVNDIVLLRNVEMLLPLLSSMRGGEGVSGDGGSGAASTGYTAHK